jgi:hypothetical protein
MPTKSASRKAAQRAYPALEKCESCGTTERLQRHHPDLSDALSVVILCQSCHAAADQALGKWGRGNRPAKVCSICGHSFTDYSHSRVKNCSPECVAEAGRRNARKRWDRVRTDCEPSATP